VPEAAVVETHISVLFFVGDRVFKLHKSVRFGFLDFTDRTTRKLDCERELALNRRLAPDVYLGVADLWLGGEPVDHMVVMRRLPEGRRLATLARNDGDISGCLRQVARTLVTFHAGAVRSTEISATATGPALRAGWESNFTQTDTFVGPELDECAEQRLRGLACRYLEGRDPLLASRIASGRVCDGHGDLQAEDIFCLDDGPRILDCIEFDDTLRYGDVISDVSFLATDLERLECFDAADQLLRDYQELAGDRFPESLVHHHSALHAYVRAKVACLRHAQGEQRALREARHLHGLALEHLELGRVRLVLVGGLPGTGKSTVAAGLAATRGWVVLRSDEVRKELAGPTSEDPGGPTSKDPGGPTSKDPAAPAYREGIYDAETTAATYRVLLERAREALGLGESVVLDASWSDSRWRKTAADVAAHSSSDLLELRCDLDSHEAARRLTSRKSQGADVSDATPEVAALMAREFDPWPSAVVVDTSVSTDAVVARALEIVDGRR
jgi:aminoglycoside phosphotransferase family enzyme/predicted kinase